MQQIIRRHMKMVKLLFIVQLVNGSQMSSWVGYNSGSTMRHTVGKHYAQIANTEDNAGWRMGQTRHQECGWLKH